MNDELFKEVVEALREFLHSYMTEDSELQLADDPCEKARDRAEAVLAKVEAQYEEEG